MKLIGEKLGGSNNDMPNDQIMGDSSQGSLHGPKEWILNRVNCCITHHIILKNVV